MALNFTVSYTFSPNTTISSSQVNTNTSDVANVFTGLEALTKTLAKLKVDVDPSTALEVSTKQYVDHYSTYRRPVLQYSSGTVVNVEAGINGTSGQAQILFPDGNLRTDSTSGRINCNLAQVAALSGSAQSGLRTGTVANNTWYAIYAVKVSDSTANFVTVADVLFPTQANFSTFNSNYGSNSWVYLGLIRYGDQGGAASAIPKFVMSGHVTIFNNANTGGNVTTQNGLEFATAASATSTTYTYAAGGSGAQIPSTINMVLWQFACATGSGSGTIQSVGGTYALCRFDGTHIYANRIWGAAVDGLNIANASATGMDILLAGWIDPVLGVGSNPIL